MPGQVPSIGAHVPGESADFVAAKVHRAQAMRSRPLLERIAAALVLCWACIANAQTYAAETNPTNLTVLVLDESQLPVPDARVEIKVGDQLILTAPTAAA